MLGNKVWKYENDILAALEYNVNIQTPFLESVFFLVFSINKIIQINVFYDKIIQNIL